MSVSDEGVSSCASEVFWDIGHYKHTVKQLDDGLRLCNDLITMVKERCELEVTYAKNLKNWSKNWAEKIDKGPEYGTMEAAWRGFAEEGDKRCEYHMRIRERLLEEVVNTIKTWYKGHFHKNALGTVRETKDMEESFRKAQKPWAKLYFKAEKLKKEYHVACKTERSAQVREKNAQQDTSVSQDDLKKLHDRVDKAKEEKERLREIYIKALKDLSDYNGRYVEDMTQVYKKCEEREQERLKFFKEMLLGVHHVLDMSNDSRIKEIYEEMLSTVQMADYKQDLKWFSQNHGLGMPTKWPSFEEYSEELHAISNSRINIRGHVAAAGTIQLTGLNAEKHQQEFVEYTPELRQISKKQSLVSKKCGGDGVFLIGQKPMKGSPISAPLSTVQPSSENHDVVSRNGSCNANNMSTVDRTSSLSANNRFYTSAESMTSRSSSAENNFADDFDNDADVLHDNGEAGVPVKALYDYAGAESDELSFRKGDVFEKLGDEDEQGWCKGRKDGTIGLYPANYVELVT